MKKILYLTTLSVATMLTLSSYNANAVIASIDSGIEPGSAGTSREIGGYDFTENDDTPQDETANRHGIVETQIIIRDFPTAQIMPLKIVGSNFKDG